MTHDEIIALANENGITLVGEAMFTFANLIEDRITERITMWPSRTFNEWLDEKTGGDCPSRRDCFSERERAAAMLAWDAAREN